MFKKESKVIAIILTLVLVLSMCCMSVTAAEEDLTNTKTVQVTAGEEITYNVYLSYADSFEGIQFSIMVISSLIQISLHLSPQSVTRQSSLCLSSMIRVAMCS